MSAVLTKSERSRIWRNVPASTSSCSDRSRFIFISFYFILFHFISVQFSSVQFRSVQFSSVQFSSVEGDSPACQYTLKNLSASVLLGLKTAIEEKTSLSTLGLLEFQIYTVDTTMLSGLT